MALIECKLDSTQGDKQLVRYKALLMSQSARSRTLIYITKYPELVEGVDNEPGFAFRQLRWHDVYVFLRDRQTKGLSKSELLDELIRFMEDLHMTFEITLADAISGVRHATTYDKYRSILDDAWNHSRLASRWEANKTGNWISSGVDATDIGCWSPYYSDTGVRLGFGFRFDTSAPGQLNLNFQSRELPVVYLALWTDKEGLKFAEDHKSYLQVLTTRGWERGRDLALGPAFVARKQLVIDVLTGDIGQHFTELLRRALDELYDAPFLQTNGS